MNEIIRNLLLHKDLQRCVKKIIWHIKNLLSDTPQHSRHSRCSWKFMPSSLHSTLP